MTTSTSETFFADRDRIDELAGRYRLVRLLASGGMSAVWLADDVRLRRRVAVKVLAVALAQDERFVERFRREVRIGARLSHPNLVPIFDFGEEPWPYLVTEYVAGGTLADRIHSERGFEGDPLRLAVELLRALAHVHGGGIVHRDVTPANVLFDAGDGRARLTDFGIAQTPRDSRLTQTGMVIGTLSYLAPEVLRGEPADARSDLYSLGVVLADSAREQGPVPLERLIARLTARTPAARPASAVAALQMIGARPSESLHERTPPPAASDPPAAVMTGATAAMPAPLTGATAAAMPAGGALVEDAADEGPTHTLPRREPTALLPASPPPSAPPPAPLRVAPAVPSPSGVRRRARRAAILLLVVLVLAAVALVLRGAQLYYGGHDPPHTGGSAVGTQLSALERAVQGDTQH